MANNCITEFVLEGDRKFLERLNDAILKNNYHWVGDIIAAANLMTDADIKETAEYKSCNLRASWYDTDLQPGCDGDYKTGDYAVLRIYEDSKWVRSSAMSLVMRILDKQVEDGIIDENPISSIYFATEEPGCGIFEIHDEEGKYFDYDVSVYLCDEGEQEYFVNKEDALEWINERTNRDFKTLEEVTADDDIEICVYEFEHVSEI